MAAVTSDSYFHTPSIQTNSGTTWDVFATFSGHCAMAKNWLHYGKLLII